MFWIFLLVFEDIIAINEPTYTGISNSGIVVTVDIFGIFDFVEYI